MNPKKPSKPNMLRKFEGVKLTNEAKVPCAAPLHNPSLSGSVGAIEGPKIFLKYLGVSVLQL